MRFFHSAGFYVTLAIIHTCITIGQWSTVLRWIGFRHQIEAEYAPEVIRQAHVNLALPGGMAQLAVAGTIVSVLLWLLAYRRAER